MSIIDMTARIHRLICWLCLDLCTLPKSIDASDASHPHVFSISVFRQESTAILLNILYIIVAMTSFLLMLDQFIS